MKNFVRKKVIIKHPLFPEFETNEWFLITRDGNAFIAKSLINNSSELSQGQFTDQHHYRAMIMHHNMETDLNYLDPKSPDAYKWLIRTAYPQFRYERTYGDIVGRYLMMFDLPEAEEVNEMCQELLGLTFNEIVTIGLCSFGQISDNRCMSVSALVNHTISYDWIKRCLVKEKVDRFVELYSTTPSDFRVAAREWKAKNTILPLQKYEFNPLWSTPLIRFSLVGDMKKRLIAPSVPDLVYASCEGVYFKAMDASRGAGKQNEFSNAFGKVFEHYVLKLLDLTGIKYQPGDQNEKKLDALVEGKMRNVHIECKKNIMSNEARVCAGDALERYIERLAIENIYGQLHKKREPDSINLLVCMDDLFFFDERVKPVIKEKLKEQDDYDPSFKFHIIGITDLEVIMTVMKRKKVTLEEIFTAKEEEAYYQDAGIFATEKFECKVTEPEYLRKRYCDFTDSWKK